MHLVLWTLAAAVAISTPAAAQVDPERYRPMAVGDIWTYRQDTRTGGGTGTCGAQVPERYEQVEVVGDTLYEGESRRLATCRTYTLEGSESGVSRYAVRTEPNGSLAVAEVGDGTGCDMVAAGQIIRLTVTEPGTIVVGGIGYDVPGVVSWNIGGPAGPGGGSWWQEGTFGADVGPVRYESGSSRQLSPAFCSATVRELEHAVVGGAAYGVAPVATEPLPRSESAQIALTVGLNPVRGQVTLGITLFQAARSVRVDVFDAVGRRIYGADLGGRPAGTHSVALDGSSWAPGLYLMRVSTTEGVATARVARADRD